MRLRKPSGALAASLVALALAISACGGAKDSRNAGRTAPISMLEQVAYQPRDALQQGGTLHLAMDQWSTNWQVESRNGDTGADTALVMSAMLPSPFHFGADGTPVSDGDYLTAEPVETTVAGKQTITYDLNPKAIWSDGTPITYKDWVADWKALDGGDKAYAPADTEGYDRISSVAEGVNEHEVVVTFASAFTDWKSLFAPLYPASEVATAEAFNHKLTASLGLSAGPFTQGSINAADQTVTLVANPKWWGEPPMLSAITFTTVAADGQAQAFADGEIDSVDIGVDPAALKTAEAAKNAVVVRAGSSQYRQLTMNAASPYLADQSVRQAIAEALDRQAIAQSDLAGMDVPETVLDSHFFMPSQLGYADDAGEVGAYDPAAARRLLTRAGWIQAAGSRYRTKGGKQLDLSLLIQKGVQVAAGEASQIISMLEQVGIKVTVTQEGDDFLTKVAAGGFDLAVFARTLDEFPVSSNVAHYQGDTAQGGTWGTNYSHLASLSLDSLLAKATSAVTLADETTIINQADQQVWQEAGSIPFYQGPEIDVQAPNLANYGAFGYADVVWQNVGFVADGTPTS
ncbi:ABC transporter family substrate-binding protein [Actinospica robiniae]|uniref:ABC transporter family substrate-binding protein n=1 Tax=Actinospica robiniae TaxID=304901 RepID=UPI000425D36A|nr:ABC transporter family substrate-binding protein [Actinospica robiniae]